jgi:hypothetical protein
VSCVSYVASFSGLFFYIAPSVFSNIYLSCFLCTLCCQFLWIVLFHYPTGHIHVREYRRGHAKGQSRETGNIGYTRHRTNKCNIIPIGLYKRTFIAPSVFSNIYLSCVLCILCCQFLSIALVYCPSGITIQRNWQHRIYKTQDK